MRIVEYDWATDTVWIDRYGMVFPISYELAEGLGIEEFMFSDDPITRLVMQVNGVGYRDVTKEERRKFKDAIFKLAYGYDGSDLKLPTLKGNISFFSSEEDWIHGISPTHKGW